MMRQKLMIEALGHHTNEHTDEKDKEGRQATVYGHRT